MELDIPATIADELVVLDHKQTIKICQSPRRHCVFRNGRCEIVRVGKFAIKFGSVSAEEISNQRHAHDLLDPAIVRVPRIHSYFHANSVDYVVMDYIDGEKRDSIQDTATIDAIARVVDHLHTFTRDITGPVNMGICSGPLWSEDERVSLSTRHRLEAYVNSRLIRLAGKFTLASTPTVLVHGDIALRNLIFTESDIWLLDWEFAGYFPRSAEIATFRLDVGKRDLDLGFYDSLESAVLQRRPLADHESDQIKCWQELAINHIRVYRPTPQEKSGMFKRRRRLNGTLVL